MSTERMTDARALAESWRRIAAGDRKDGDEFTANRVEACADALDEIAARLRGEAQAEQPFAWVTPGQLEPWGRRESERVMKLTKDAQPEHEFTVPLYTCSSATPNLSAERKVQ